MTRPRTGRPKKARAIKPETRAALESRATYVVSLIKVEPWLDGKYLKLAAMVREHFKIGKNSSERAVTRAYEILKEEMAKLRPEMADFLARVHLTTIDQGLKDPSLRVTTAAAAELRKLQGIGEPDRVEHSGKIVTSEDLATLDGLKLTNAQRQAEIAKLRKELGDEIKEPSTVITKVTTTETVVHRDNKPAVAKEYAQPLADDEDDEEP